MKLIEALKRIYYIYKNYDTYNEYTVEELNEIQNYKKFYDRETSIMENIFKQKSYNYNLKLNYLKDKSKATTGLKMTGNSNHIYNKYSGFIKIKAKDKRKEIASILMTAITYTNPLYEIIDTIISGNDIQLSINTPLSQDIIVNILSEIYTINLSFDYELDKSFILDRSIYVLKFKDVKDLYRLYELLINSLNSKIEEHILSIIDILEKPYKVMMVDFLQDFIKEISHFDYILTLDTSEVIKDIFNSQLEFSNKILNVFKGDNNEKESDNSI